MPLLKHDSGKNSTDSISSGKSPIDVSTSQTLQDSMPGETLEANDTSVEKCDAAGYKKSLIESLENNIALMESQEQSLEQNLKALSIEAQSLEQHLKDLTSQAQPPEQQLEAIRSLQARKQEQLEQVELQYAEHSRMLKPLLQLLNGFFSEDVDGHSDLPSKTLASSRQLENEHVVGAPSE